MISPSNFGCEQARELLDDFRRNSIEPHLRVMLTEHLESCSECAAELQSRERLAKILADCLPAENQPDFSKLPSAVRLAIESGAGGSASRERKNARRLSLMLACAAVAVVGIAIMQTHIAPPEAGVSVASAPVVVSAPAADAAATDGQAMKMRPTGATPAVISERKLSREAAASATAPAAPQMRTSAVGRNYRMAGFSAPATTVVADEETSAARTLSGVAPVTSDTATSGGQTSR